MTKVFRSVKDWIIFRKNLDEKQRRQQRWGVVPTMGVLHEGHLSLIKRSKKENDFTLVTIFVNPTQFNDKKDLESYPRTFEQDLEMLKSVGADFLLCPE